MHVNGCFVFYCIQVLDYISLPAEGGDAAVFCLCVFMYVMCVTTGHTVQPGAVQLSQANPFSFSKHTQTFAQTSPHPLTFTPGSTFHASSPSCLVL